MAAVRVVITISAILLALADLVVARRAIGGILPARGGFGLSLPARPLPRSAARIAVAADTAPTAGLPLQGPKQRQQAPPWLDAAGVKVPAEIKRVAFPGRRTAALHAAAFSLSLANANARAEQPLGGTDFVYKREDERYGLTENIAKGPPARMQRVVVNVGDQKSLADEMKFWTEACLMKQRGEFTDANGLKSVVLAYGAEGSDAGIEIKVDPAVLTRRRPSMLNYKVMQPYVSALNFVQVGVVEKKVNDVFYRVQKSGGNSVFGDPTYLDVESPRGVAVRFVLRDEGSAGIELVCFNVEAPLYDPLLKFYQRGLGFQEITYDDGEPPVQKRSTLLKGRGGPKLLLSPVPDDRVKERDLDEFEHMLLVVDDKGSSSTAVEEAARLMKQEDQEYDEKLEIKIRQTQGEEQQRWRNALEARKNGETSKPKPDVQVGTGTTRINDGAGNILQVVGAEDFAKSISTVTTV